MTADIDRRVAEEVMGWKAEPGWSERPDRWDRGWHWNVAERQFCGECTGCGYDGIGEAWSPSTKIAHAWLVVERMAVLLRENRCNAYWWNFTAGAFTDPCLGRLCIERPDDVPLEICKAALQALSAVRGGEGSGDV